MTNSSSWKKRLTTLEIFLSNSLSCPQQTSSSHQGGKSSGAKILFIAIGRWHINPPETPWDPLCLIYTEQSKEGSLKGMFLLDNIIGTSVSVALKIPSIGASWLISFRDHLESQDELWSFQTGGFLLSLGQLLLVLAYFFKHWVWTK